MPCLKRFSKVFYKLHKSLYGILHQLEIKFNLVMFAVIKCQVWIACCKPTKSVLHIDVYFCIWISIFCSTYQYLSFNSWISILTFLKKTSIKGNVYQIVPFGNQLSHENTISFLDLSWRIIYVICTFRNMLIKFG